MPRPPRSSWKRLALWSLPVVALLAVGGGLFLRASVQAYLRSDGFRTLIARKAGETLHAEVTVAPVHFTGSTFYTNQVAARGEEGARFSVLEVEGLRAELSWRRLLEQVWLVERVEVQRLRVDLNGPRPERTAPAAPPEAPPAPAGETRRAAWLPDRFELGSATFREAHLAWSGGLLRGVAAEVRPQEGGWKIEATGGTIEHGALPPLAVERLDLQFREPVLFIRAAEFRQGAGGTVVTDGEIDFRERLNLRATIRNVTLTPWLAGDWRARLRGEASGEVTIASSLPPSGAPEIRGQLSLANGQLEALPILNEIAAFTRTAQFRRLALSRASCDFVQRGERLEARNLVLESERLIRVEGAFTVQGAEIDGVFQVGVTPASLQWLPGSQARVFTESRGGYLWAPMRLTGPVQAPKEDLSPRLIAAAGNAVIDQATGVVRDATKTLQEAARGALDLLLGPGK